MKHSSRSVRVEPKIKFKYVDEEDNTFIFHKKPKQEYKQVPPVTTRVYHQSGPGGTPFFMPISKQSSQVFLTDIDKSLTSDFILKKYQGKTLRKTVSAPSIDLMNYRSSPTNVEDEDSVPQTPFLLRNPSNQIHQPHKYYNFGELRK